MHVGSTIEITRDGGNNYTVTHGDRYANNLTWAEALASVAAEICADLPKRSFLRAQEEHEAFEEKFLRPRKPTPLRPREA
jgi:hypothetical protein